MTQLQKVQGLARILKTDPTPLNYAKNIATAIVTGPSNHCAATLSALLVFSGIYPIGCGNGTGNLEAWVPNLNKNLKEKLGWQQIDYSLQQGPAQSIQVGDVAVVMEGDTHHIFLIIDPKDGKTPLIADNQCAGIHDRPLAGNPEHRYSAIHHILRAPNT